MSSGVLYLVGTPIGNLSDITVRAVETLKSVNFIAAEDTRVSIKLLNHLDISNSLISYHEHNEIQKGQYIINRILSGESCALISDAGMPCISDPGEGLVSLAMENNIIVQVIPGPSACISALSISGLSTSRFSFEGFLSTNKKNRKIHLESIKNDTRTLIFYEAPHKLKKTLMDLLLVLGDRKISLVKELTKIHESVNLTSLSEAVKQYNEMENIRGEYVLIVDGAKIHEEEKTSISDAIKMVNTMVDSEDISTTDAIRRVAEITGHKKNILYKAIYEN
jgi:16S rRNA (cytidine1402-2'-O)-methyltransferase